MIDPSREPFLASIPVPGVDETEEGFLARIRLQQTRLCALIASGLLTVAAPITTLYDAPQRVLHAGVLAAAAILALTILPAVAWGRSSPRRSHLVALYLSVLMLVPASTATVLNPLGEHGAALYFFAFGCAVYCKSRRWYWAHYGLYLAAVALSWKLAGLTFEAIDALNNLVIVPTIGFLISLMFEDSLIGNYRQFRQTLAHQQQLADALEKLVIETARRHQEESRRRQSEEAIKEQQEQLLHVSRLSAMGELAAGIAHEVHQPMHAMSMYCGAVDVLISEPELDIERIRTTVGRISDLLQQCATIIRRLRRFTRKGERAFHRVDLHPVIVDAVELTHSSTRRHRVDVEQDLTAAVSEVVIDPVQIQQVLVNLIRNACEAMAECPEDQRAVQISTSADSETITIRVQDSGTGIEGDSSRIFDTFYSTKSDGMGIGLAISRTIVRQHQGRINVLSNPDRGVTFVITLPLADYFDEQEET